MTRKQVTGGATRVETGHSLPVLLPPAVEAAVYREVKGAIRTTGIRRGASHTEVIVGGDGQCTVIEIGARLAAGHIGVQIQHALGIDVWAALLDVALGRSAALAPTACGYATVRFVTSSRAGRLMAVDGFPKMGPGVPFVRWRAGRVSRPAPMPGRVVELPASRHPPERRRDRGAGHPDVFPADERRAYGASAPASACNLRRRQVPVSGAVRCEDRRGFSRRLSTGTRARGGDDPGWAEGLSRAAEMRRRRSGP
ncbi:hypothetical protein [Streptomyces sp. NPDC057302]|uniref:hypothetical protein n=1 Tax=Streptomyces sp. NPDC057302 TaxID=3346094 RepID=UPI00363964B8